jgi:hypothetical protein
MRHTVANWLNEIGRQSDNSSRAERFYKLATRIEPRWSVPWYNLGFRTKMAGQWEDSLHFNQRTVELNADDEAAWWNLGIAATALHNWAEARRAWRGFGIAIEDGPGEVSWTPATACVRLDPNHLGEVVWGERLDPARIAVLNVPLPESNRRYRDIILNDGAPNGTRKRNGRDVPVFDELAVWQASSYSTFQVELSVPNEEAEQILRKIANDHDVGVEDWSTIRMICADCSRGNPQPHSCKAVPLDGERRRFGFGAHEPGDVERVLVEWVTKTRGSAYGDVELALAAIG